MPATRALYAAAIISVEERGSAVDMVPLLPCSDRNIRRAWGLCLLENWATEAFRLASFCKGVSNLRVKNLDLLWPFLPEGLIYHSSMTFLKATTLITESSSY